MKFPVLLMVLTLGAACGGKDDARAPAAGPARSAIFLSADPGEAASVRDAIDAEDGAEVVVVGRVRKLVTGYALFHLIDESLEYCGQVKTEDECPTPWDYCCYPQPEQVDATVVVEVVGPDGAVVERDAEGLRLLDLVVVKGRMERDEHDNPVLKARGYFRRARPELREGLIWPE